MRYTEATRYVAEDGTEFISSQAADAYVELAEKVVAAVTGLVPRPEPFPFQQYVQQDLVAVRAAWNALLDIAVEQMGEHAWFTDSRDMKAHTSWAGRLIGELDGKVFWSKGWFRMSCINRATGREYDQPYYANHPEETADFRPSAPTPAPPVI